MPLKLVASLKANAGIIVVGLLLALLVSAPLIAFPFFTKEAYQGINIAHFDRTDSHFYLSRGQEVLEGHALGNITIREGKDQPDPYFNYGERLILIPLRVLGFASQINVVTLYSVSNFIGVFWLALLIYGLMMQFSGTKLLSIVAAAFVIGGYHFIYTKSFFYNDFNFYGRPMYPCVSSVGFFIFLNFLIRSIESAALKPKIYAGLALGVLFYISFYAWTFSLALNSILILLLILKKDFARAKNTLWITGLGTMLGSFNLYKLMSFNNSEMGKQVSRFFLAIPSHTPIFSGLGFLALGLFLIYWLKRRDDKNMLFILALILASWLALNQQIVTGIILQYGHYYWYFIVPAIIFIGLYLVWFLMGNNRYRSVFFALVLGFVFVHAALGQYRSFFTTADAKIYEQSYKPLIDTLNMDVQTDVILGPINRLGLLFTIYTKHDLFWNQVAVWSYNEPERFKDVLYIYSYLNKNSGGDWGSPASSDEVAAIYEKVLDLGLNDKQLLEREYAQISNDKGVTALLHKYGVNRIVWDKNIDPDWDLSKISGLKEIFHSGNIYLYSLMI